MKKKYNVGVVGVGLVGRKILELLVERNFPAKSIKVLATRARKERINAQEYSVVATSEAEFAGLDITFFAGTEGVKGASREYGWLAVEKGSIVIDNGSDFRLESGVPLVVPEVNSEALKNHQGFIANPNCSTIQMVVVIWPLHQVAKLKRVIAVTYQAVSGTGRAAVRELEEQIKNYSQGKHSSPEVYPYEIAFNLIPQIGSLSSEFPGYFTEEVKMIKETRKILSLPKLPLTATCVRVPVFNSHSEVLNLEFEKKITPEEAREVLAKAPGVKVIDEPNKSIYPTPKELSERDEVFVGRIRQDTSRENCLTLWVVSDNIRKGAALNALQIAEKMIELGLI